MKGANNTLKTTLKRSTGGTARHSQHPEVPPVAVPGGDELLAATMVAVKYDQVWMDRAWEGHSRNLLRKEQLRHEESIFPVWQYLADLAASARISLDAAIAAFGLETKPVVGVATASAISRALRNLGCTAEAALRMIRLSFAEVHGESLMPALLMVKAPRGGKISPARVADEELARVESRYPAQLQSELAEIQAAVSAEFKGK